MKAVVFVWLGLATVCSMQASTTFTCTAPGYSSSGSQDCTFPDGSLVLTGFDTLSLSGNTVTMQSQAFVQSYDPALSVLVPKTAVGDWSQTMLIPANPDSDDVLKITYDTFGILQNVNFTVGSWSDTAPCFDAHFGCFGPLPHTPQATINLARGPGSLAMSASGSFQFSVQFANEDILHSGCNWAALAQCSPYSVTWRTA